MDDFSRIPRHPLTYPHPSPIHRLPRLTSANQSTSIPVSVFAKRDDHSSPLACAGNKYRKLEYIVPDILGARLHADIDAGIDLSSLLPSSPSSPPRTTVLVTEGAIQSNHTVQVSSLAAQLGLHSVAILHRGLGGGFASATDRSAFLRTGNVPILRLLGADIRFLDDDAAPAVLQDLVRSGHVPYWIPSGASLHPLGGLGYARCALEIARQESSVLGPSTADPTPGSHSPGTTHNRRFDYVFAACGSGSTVGGLIAGFKLLEKLEAQQQQREREGHTADSTAAATTPAATESIRASARPRLPRRVVGILTSPSRPRAFHEERVLSFARAAARLIGLDPEDISMDDVRLDDRFVGSAYGVVDRETADVLKRFAAEESLVLDPVYTSKAARGMMHWLEQGELVADYCSRRREAEAEAAAAAAAGPGDGDGSSEEEEDTINVLLIHTGGQAALGAYADMIFKDS